jgi:single-strand DNA-binding protein
MSFVFIAGHLGRDAETGFTQSGKKVVTLSIGTTSRRGDKDETIWWRVSVWGDRYDKMLPYLLKGKPIMVRGELRKPRTYVDKNGVTQVSSLEVDADTIHFSPFGKPDQQGQQSAQTPYTAAPQPAVAAGAATAARADDFESEDDQIPF